MQSRPETQDASSSTGDTVLGVNCFDRRCSNGVPEGETIGQLIRLFGQFLTACFTFLTALVNRFDSVATLNQAACGFF
jgi:hypothetical protein